MDQNHCDDPKTGLKNGERNFKHTQPIAGKKPPLIPITLLGLKEKKISTKIDFCTKTFLSAIYFDVIL